MNTFTRLTLSADRTIVCTMRNRSWVWIAAVFWMACGGGGGGGTTDAGGGDTGGGGCPLTLRVDGVTYTAITCQAQGFKTVAAGLYQIDFAAQFNRDPPRIRSIAFTVRDSDDAPTASHVRDYDASQSNPGADATYHETSLDPGWSTLASAVKVGSGTLTLTRYDRAARRMSGTFSIVALKGTDAKTLEGSFTDLPLTTAD